MSELIPPLAWLDSFSYSLGGALGTTVLVQVLPSVNPLVYIIKLRFGEAVSGKRMMLVWNLFQQYAAKNETIPDGKLEQEGPQLTLKVIVRRKMGPPRDDHPAA